MRHYAKKAAAIGFLVFLGLWIFGAVRGLTLPYPPPLPLPISIASASDDYSSNRTAQQGNFAHNLKQLGMEKTPLPMVIDQAEIERIQIHEKAGHMTAGSADFDADETKIRDALAAHKASTVTEKDSGIAPQRRLAIEVGVHPEKFDSLVADLRKIGVLSSIRIEQTDRTAEFRKLHAQRQSLKKFFESVLKLRSTEKLSIDDALRLDQKIKEIENELRPLSDQLGDFLGKESYYHVQVTLSSTNPATAAIRPTRRRSGFSTHSSGPSCGGSPSLWRLES